MLLLSACGSAPLCDSEVVDVSRAPDSDFYAVTEVRNCGATTSFATVVRIGRASEPQRDAAEIFVADSDHGAATALGNGIWTDVDWAAPNRLRLRYASRARVFKSLPAIRGIRVDFTPGEPAASPSTE